MSEQVPVIFDENDTRMIPEEQVPDAVKNGGKVAVRMMFPGQDGKSDYRYVPAELASEAHKNGGIPVPGLQSVGRPAAPEVKPVSRYQGGPLEGTRTTLKRESSALSDDLKGMPGSIYHSVVDAPTDEEKNDPRYGLKAHPVVGRIALPIARNTVAPIGNAADWYAREAKHDDLSGMESKMLSVAPEGLASAGANILAFKGAGDLMKAAVTAPATSGGAPLPAGAEGPVNPIAGTAKFAKPSFGRIATAVGTNVPFTDMPLTTAASGALGAIGRTGVDLAKSGVKAGAKAAGGAIADAAAGAARTAGDWAVRGGVNFAEGALDAVKEKISNGIEMALQNPTGEGFKTQVQNILVKAGEQAQPLLDKAADLSSDILTAVRENAGEPIKAIIDRVVDEYYMLKNPSVSGGHQGAFVNPPMSRVAPGVSPINAARAESPTNLPITEKGYRQIGDNQTENPVFNARIEHPEVGRVATPGQLQGGARATFERSVRLIPHIGRMLNEGMDAQQKAVLSQAVKDLAAKNFDGAGGRTLAGLLAKATDKYGVVDFRALREAMDDPTKLAVKNDAVDSFRRLVDAGERMQLDWSRSSLKGLPGYMTGHAPLIFLSLLGFATGGIGGMVAGAAAGLIGEAAQTALIRYMITPTGMTSATTFWKIATKINPTPEEVTSANAMAEQMWKDIRRAADPGKHEISKSGFQKANPKARPEVLNKQLIKARQGGFKVTE